MIAKVLEEDLDRPSASPYLVEDEEIRSSDTPKSDPR